MNLWQIKDEKLRLSLHPGQAKAWRSKRRFTFVIAGTQGGKTTFGPLWLWREIGNCGAGDYLAVTSSYKLFDRKMLPAMREWFEHTYPIGRYWRGAQIIEIRDPEKGFLAKHADDAMYARILLGSAASPEGLEAATAKAAWLDECGQDEFTLETWQAVLRRLSLAQGRALGTTTPYNAGWLKTEIYDRWRKGDRDYQVVQFPSTLNPIFPRAEFQRAKRTMQAHRFRMFYEGLFDKPPGLIYESYLDDYLTNGKGGHLVAPFPIPPEWPRYVGVDFGGANTALVWVAENPETHLRYAYRESLSGGKTTKEHAKEYLDLAAHENVIGVWGGAASEQQQRDDWNDNGVPIQQPPIGDVEGGIDRVAGMFAAHTLYVFDSLSGLRDELGGYRRKLDANGQVTDEIVDKRKYHRLDATRYVGSGIAEGGHWFLH